MRTSRVPAVRALAAASALVLAACATQPQAQPEPSDLPAEPRPNAVTPQRDPKPMTDFVRDALADAHAKRAAPPAPPTRLLPDSIDFTMPNGIRVFLVPDHEVPLLGFEMRIAGGTTDDPEGREGATALLAGLLTDGAGSRNRATFQEDVEFVGGTFTAGAAPRWISVSAEFLKDDADLAVELLSDVVMRPQLDPAEFQKEKGQALDGLSAAREEPQQLIGRYWSHWVFTGHPYARPWSGDESSLAKLTIDDVKAAASRQLAPQRTWIAVAGDFDPAAMRSKLESRFGSWSSRVAAPPTVPAWKGTAGGSVLLVDKPDAMQTYFWFGNRGFERSDPDFAARTVANSVLGERFTSRLNKVLRTEKGFTYGAGARFDDARQGLFWISTQGTGTATTAECIPLAESLYRKFVREGMTAEELASTKAYISGQFGLGFETGDQQASTILDLAFEGLPRDLVDGHLGRVQALTLEDVNRVITTRYPKELDWVVIGQASVCRSVMTPFGKLTECKVTDPGFGPSRD